MFILRLLLACLVQLAWVAIRRLLRGRRRPRWTFVMEVFQGVALMVGVWLMARPARALRALRVRPPRRAVAGIRTERVDAGGCPAEWILPSSDPDLPVLLYLHGGGYLACSVDTHWTILTGLARAVPARVLALEYRLAPEHPFPAAVEDAVRAYAWLLAQGHAPGRVTVAGDSAGGGLALALLLALKDRGLPMPAAAACMSPWTDLAATGESLRLNDGQDFIRSRWVGTAADLYLRGQDARHPLASPLYGNLAGLPPLLIQAGELEIIRDDSVRLWQRATDAGVEATLRVYPDMFHVWQAFLGLSADADAALKEVARFLGERAGGAPGAAGPPGPPGSPGGR